MNLFLVDDDPVIRAGMAKIIEKNGENYTVVGEASDGELALEAIRERDDIDLIMTDIRMPVMDGLELIREVRKFDKRVKIIVLSGFDDYKYVRSAFMDGAGDYLLKPIVKKDLLDLLAKIKGQLEQEKQETGLDYVDEARKYKKYLYRFTHRQYDETEYEELLEKLKIKADAKLLCMVLKMDVGYEDRHDQGYYETVLEDSLVKLNNIFALDNRYHFSCYIENDKIIIFVSSANPIEVRELIGKYFMYIKNTPLHEEMTFTMGVSQVSEPAQAQQLFDEAMQAADAGFYEGRECAIEYAKLCGYKVLSDNLEKERDALCEAYNLGDYIKVRNALKTIYTVLEGASPEEVRHRTRLLFHYLILHARDYAEALDACGYDYEYFIANAVTFEELKERSMAGVKGVLEKMAEERGKRSKRRIELAKTYMEEHYFEPLTLNNIADYVELNASYFSNLFKKETNQNFSEYLLDLRIDKAKKLLIDPTIKVYEVGNMVGYEDAVSFGRAFKKKIGLSPKEYRNTVC